MAEVVWKRPALADLSEVRLFIARDSPTYADLTVRRIQSSVGRLRQFPRSGRAVPEFPDSGLREVILSPYRVIYRYDSDADLVTVLTIVHGARTLSSDPPSY